MPNYHKILTLFYPDMEWEINGPITVYNNITWLGGTPSMPNQATLDAWDPFIPNYEMDYDEDTEEVGRNETGNPITKGTPVYASGVDGTASQMLIAPCDADDPATFPCIGIVAADIPNNTTGAVQVEDKMKNLDTSSFTKNDCLFPASGGGWTATAPTGETGSPAVGRSAQKVARVKKSDATKGEIIVDLGEASQAQTAAEGGTGDQACVLNRRATSAQVFTVDPTVTTLAFQTNEIQNLPEIIEDTSDTVITVKEDGLYQVAVNLIVSADNSDAQVWLARNGSEIAGTRTDFNPDNSIKTVTPTWSVMLNANDQLSVKGYQLGGGNDQMDINSSIDVIRLGGRGPAGEAVPGPSGSGVNINVYDDGSPVTGTPHAVLNFQGFAIADAGGDPNQVNIAGAIKQVVRKTVTANLSTSVTIDPATTPTSTSGVAFDNITITTTGSSEVRFQLMLPADSTNDAGTGIIVVSRGSTVVAVGAKNLTKKSMDAGQIVMDFYDTPGAGTHTYSVRVGTRGGNTTFFNQGATNTNPWGGFWRKNCSITLTELT